jgi:hypothetical protein
MNDNRYSTTDLWLASYLKANNLRITDIEREGRRVTFIFEDREDREQLVKDFFNDGLIKVNALKNAFQDLKSVVFNL